jgi:hypothetical protein
MKLTKEQILEKISEKEIFDHFLKPFHEGMVLKPGQNISNPLLSNKQKTPSFNIYEQNGKWKFKDFSTADSGDCWQFIMLLKNINFSEALELITTQLLLPEQSFPKTQLHFSSKKKPLIFHRVFNSKEKGFWLQYGINEETLKLFKVRAITNYIAYTKEGKEYEVKNHNDALMFSYDYGNSYKIYKPNDKTNRFIYLGERDQNFFFGIDQLPKNGKHVFITGGEKDVMTLHAHGYASICMNSETATIPENLITNLKKRFERVIVLYDNDETGIKQSQKISNDHKILRLQLPDIANNGKDISDFFLNGGTKTHFKTLIDNIQEFAMIANKTNDTILADEIANFVDFANFAISSENGINDSFTPKRDSILLETPTIPKDLFDQLPKLLKESCSAFKHQREKDVFLTSALGILSGCLPNVHGIYGGKKVYPNLYTFILAPAANGKGTMNSAQDLGIKYHNYLLNKSKEAKKEFDSDMDNYLKSKNNNQESERPEKPNFELLYLPANSSSSKIYHHLSENNGKGIICETEADTLGLMFKKDWSSYSDLLRKGFHHERLTQSRISDNQYMEIKESKISVVLSGTPNQIFNIITNAEDGLFSRFIYYLYQSEQKWVSQRPDASGFNLNDFFENQSEEVFEMVRFFELQPATFNLNNDQWNDKDEMFNEYLERIIQISGKESEGVIKRMGLIFYRICMILTAVRYFDNRFPSPFLDCNQNDFNIAKKLIRIYLEHSLIMFENLPKSSKHSITKRPTKIDELFASLPSSFKRQDAVLKAPEFGLSVKTVDNFLRDEKGKSLHSPKAGEYEKVGDNIE